MVIMMVSTDMLHSTLLPFHGEDLTANLSLVVIDEAHVYNGVFGSHVALIIRRLQRLFHLYNDDGDGDGDGGGRMQFVACSATIANPKQHLEALVGLAFKLIDSDSAPTGKRWFALWNPALKVETNVWRLQLFNGDGDNG